MPGKTAWMKGEGQERDFQIRTTQMWECWRNGWLRWLEPSGYPKPFTAKPRDTQCCFGGWVDIWVLTAPKAAMPGFEFPRAGGKGRILQAFHRLGRVVEEW